MWNGNNRVDIVLDLNAEDIHAVSRPSKYNILGKISVVEADTIQTVISLVRPRMAHTSTSRNRS